MVGSKGRAVLGLVHVPKTERMLTRKEKKYIYVYICYVADFI